MPSPAVAGVIGLVLSNGPLPGGGRLLCVDGPAGSGKTTLATAVADAFPGTTALVHMDDLYAGWSGLADPGLGDRIRAEIAEPYAAGRSGRYRRFDWTLGGFAEENVVSPVDLLVLEGVGAGARELTAVRTALIWVEAPEPVRTERGIDRDRELHAARGLDWDETAYRRSWDAFVADERTFFTRHRLPGSADLRIDGSGPGA